MIEYPLVSFLIPVKDEEKNLAGCLDSILSLDYPSDKIEILLALYDLNDASGRIAESYRQKYPSIVKTFSNLTGNTSMGRNICLRHAKGDFVMNYSAHVVCPSDMLKVLVERLRNSDEMVAGVGCSNVNPDSQNMIGEVSGAAFQSLMGGKGLFQQNASYGEEREVDHISFCLYKKKVLGDGFDPLFWTGQDAELDLRLKQHGYRILYTPGTKVYHYKRETIGGLSNQMYRYGVARAKIIRKHHGSLRWFYLLGPLFVIGLFGVLLFTALSILPLFLLVFLICFYVGVSWLSVFMKAKPLVVFISPLFFFLIHFWYGLGFIRGWLFKHKFSDGGVWGWT